MRFSSEAEMQSWFTGWIEEVGGFADAPNAAFELKHVACDGMKGCSRTACARPLRVGRHEAMQVTALLRSEGKVGRGLSYKFSDEARGYKPFDCVYLRGARGFVLFGWSCGKGGRNEGKRFALYRIPAEVMGRELYGGRRSVREVEAGEMGTLVFADGKMQVAGGG